MCNPGVKSEVVCKACEGKGGVRVTDDKGNTVYKKCPRCDGYAKFVFR